MVKVCIQVPVMLKNMIMKIRTFLILLITALFMSNCSQEDNALSSYQGNVCTFKATVEGGTRSTVTDGGTFSWTTGDEISVWNGNKYQVFTYSGEGNEFTGTETEASGYAIYPSGNHGDVGENALPEVHLKDTYTYGSTNAIMLAKVQEGSNSLSFKHLGGLMRFIVRNVPADETSFTFTANSGITGDFQVEEVDGSNVIGMIDATEQNKMVMIQFEASNEVTDKTFYIPLPIGTYAGFTIAVGDLTYVSKAQNVINRGTLLLMPTFECNNGALEKENGNTIVLEDNENTEVNVSSGEVVIDAKNVSDASVTLNYSPVGNHSSLTITDDSHPDSLPAEESKATVNVEIPENSSVSSLNVNAPTLTVALSATSGNATFESVEAKTANETLIINSGVTVTTLTIKGGNVVIEEGATVTSIINESDAIIYVVNKGTLINTPAGDSKIVVVSSEEWALKDVVANGGEYTLNDDVALNEPLVIANNKEVVLNLNGKKISYTSTSDSASSLIKVSSGAKLTLKDGSVIFAATTPDTGWGGDGQPEFPGYANNTIVNSGTLIVENATIENKTAKGGASYVIDNYNGANLIINDGSKIIQSGEDIAIRMFNASAGGGINVTINGGEISGYRAVWIQLAGSDVSVAPIMNLNVNGGTLTSVEQTYNQAIYSYTYGNDTKNTKIVVTEGTFEGDIALIGDYYNKSIENLETLLVSGGTFNGTYGVYSYGDSTKAKETIKISGGKFRVDLSDYIIDGYEPEWDGEYYIVSQKL